MAVYIEAQMLCIILTVLLFLLFRFEREESLRFTGIVGILTVFALLADIGGVVFANAQLISEALCFGYEVFFALAGITLLLCLWKQNAPKKEYGIMIGGFFMLMIGAIQRIVWRNTLSLGCYMIFILLLILFCRARYKKIITDKLTGLSNRYAMDMEIKKQLRQYKKDKTDSFYIIACDLDNFKTINDTWGHAEGDRALVLIAEVLSIAAAAYNAEVFRIGGDEFVIITDTAEKGLADCITLHIKDKLDAIAFRDDFAIRMSTGTALYDGTIAVTELIDCADKKLYEAKNKKG